jgi:hypothetical protein
MKIIGPNRFRNLYYSSKNTTKLLFRKGDDSMRLEFLCDHGERKGSG